MIKDSAKTILCFGDSNTWGAIPRSDNRHPRSVRWTSVLQNLLGNDYEVISEGLPGRTFVAIDPDKPHKTGIAYLQAALESADPIDLVIVMLGTNDIKNTYNLSPEEITQHLEQTIFLIQNKDLPLEKIPQILIICPPPVIQPDVSAKSPTGQELDERMLRGPDLFKVIPDLFKKVAEKYNCGFINAGEYISSSKIDGYHLDADAHVLLAKVVQQWILKS